MSVTCTVPATRPMWRAGAELPGVEAAVQAGRSSASRAASASSQHSGSASTAATSASSEIFGPLSVGSPAATPVVVRLLLAQPRVGTGVATLTSKLHRVPGISD